MPFIEGFKGSVFIDGIDNISAPLMLYYIVGMRSF
jgi:hypothetical protein